MTSSISQNRPVSEVRADVKLWPRLRPFKHQMSDNHPLFFGAVFASMAMHALFAYLFCAVVADRKKAAGPPISTIDAPLIVSLVSLPTPTTTSHDGQDHEAVSTMPYTDPTAQDAQSPPESSRNTERKFEGESVVISKGQGVPSDESPMDKSPPADATSSIKFETAEHITQEFIRIPEIAADLVLTSKGQGGISPGAPAGKSLVTGTTPSIDIEAAIAKEVGRMSMTDSELQDFRFKSMALYQKNHPDGPSFAGRGLLSAPFFLKDIIIGNGYKWFMQEAPERQKDTQERIDLTSDLMWDLAFDSL